MMTAHFQKMRAKITKIDPLKVSQTEKAFRRIYFQLETGEWAKTDVVAEYRNYKNWKAIIQLVDAGAEVFVEGLVLRRKGEVDADSRVRYTDNKFEIVKTPTGKIKQDTLL